MAEYRIDDLARKAGTTVRNVRAYQERGLLQPPRRAGRVALYDEAHLARLRLVLRLLERGATLQLIGDLVDAWHEGHNIADLLGLEAALLAPGTEEEPGAVVSAGELAGLFGSDPDPDHLRQATELGIIAEEDGGYRVLAPRLVQIGTEIAQMGVPVDEMLDHLGALRGRIDVVARDFVDLAVRHVFPALVADAGTADLARASELVQRLRPLARAVIDLELGRALDAEISSRIADGLAGER